MMIVIGCVDGGAATSDACDAEMVVDGIVAWVIRNWVARGGFEGKSMASARGHLS